MEYEIPEEGKLKIIKTVEEIVDINCLQNKKIALLSEIGQKETELIDIQSKIDKYNELTE